MSASYHKSIDYLCLQLDYFHFMSLLAWLELLGFIFLKFFTAMINKIIFVLHAYVACIHVHTLLRWFIWFDFYIHLLKVQMHLMIMCSKATTIDGSFPPAWVGIGNAYAAQSEGDQAMAAFRSGARLFPG